MKRVPFFSVLIFLICFAAPAFSQFLPPLVQPSNDTTVSIGPKQYVKIEVGMHILDCPVLPSNLKGKLMGVKGIRDYREDYKAQSIYFNTPKDGISKEQIESIAKGCAFPPGSVNVILSDKPFTN